MGMLEGKVALISGGTRGLGYGIAQEFLREGAAVMVVSRTIQAVENAVANLKREGNHVAGTCCDVGNLEQVEALVAYVLDQFGRLDIWINNAGISCPTGPTVHIPPEMVHTLIKTNILGVYHGSIVAMRHFLAQDSGKLINLVGKGERRPVPLHNPYSSSRAWVRNFTLAMAQEYKSTNVGVFLLNPGLVTTDMLQHLHFINGYEHHLKVLRVVQRLLASPPNIPAQKAVWLASAATDGKTGLYKSAIGPGRMLKGLGQEFSRKIKRQEPPPYNPEVTLIDPVIDLELADNVALRKKREKTKPYLIHLSGKKLPEKIGNKAANLQRLIRKKFLVPDTFVLSWDAFQDYQDKTVSVLKKIRSELMNMLNPELLYAIRSSADVEDSPEHSYAGQFKTILNVQGIDTILDAVQEVWKAANPRNIQDYLHQSQTEPSNFRMAVIIQEMVTPIVSGVSFSVNPITSLDEIVVESVLGSGEQLVQEGVTPLRWVSKWGKWIENPETNKISEDVILEVVNETQKISKSFKSNIDLEWVYDGKQIYWTQMRDITALTKANIYSNKMAKEMTPGLIKPLDWSVIVPIKTTMWINIISQVIGDNHITPESLAKLINYRVYHNLGVFGGIFEILGLPRESLDIMMGIVPPGAGKPPFKPGPKFIRLLPRISRFIWKMWNFAQKAEQDFPTLQAKAKTYSLHPSQELSLNKLIALIEEIKELNLQVTTNTFLSIILMQIYRSILTAQLRKVGIDFAQFDLAEGLDELDSLNPNIHLEVLKEQYLNLSEPLQYEISRCNFKDFQKLDGTEAFRNSFNTFIEQFGHMSDRTGVFDTIPWRETPELILELIRNFEIDKDKTNHKIKYQDVKLSGMSGWLFRIFYKRARLFYVFREKYSSLYTYTLMLFRVYFLAISDRMVAQGLLDSREDIYFLQEEEILNYIRDDNTGKQLKQRIQLRREEMDHCKDAIIPEIIFGDTPPPVIRKSEQKLVGTPTSRGYYTGKTKVIRGIGDFHKLNHGDVLVIPYSDVGWIPLFSKAGAVVAESGGMLSHSSIIAREYGIPAVVSVNGALQLKDDLTISIDGYKGEVYLSNSE